MLFLVVAPRLVLAGLDDAGYQRSLSGVQPTPTTSGASGVAHRIVGYVEQVEIVVMAA